MVNNRIKSTAKVVKDKIKEAANSPSSEQHHEAAAGGQQGNAQRHLSPAQSDAHGARQHKVKL